MCQISAHAFNLLSHMFYNSTLFLATLKYILSVERKIRMSTTSFTLSRRVVLYTFSLSHSRSPFGCLFNIYKRERCVYCDSHRRRRQVFMWKNMKYKFFRLVSTFSHINLAQAKKNFRSANYVWLKNITKISIL